MTSVQDVADVVTWLEAHDDFVIGSHMNPDGDSLGSSLALAAALEQRGKRTRVVIGQALPDRHFWLPGAERIETASAPPEGCASAILVECSDFARTGLEGLEALPSLNIDHHTKNGMYAHVNWIDASVAAVGMMVGELIGALGAEIDADMAAQLYVALLTDTGSFRHSNTDASALYFAADMVAAGARPEPIASSVFGNVPAGRVQLMGDALTTLTLEQGGQIAWMRLGRDQFEARGTTDTEGVINHAQGIAGVRVSLLFKEPEPDVFRISFRSDGSIDVAELASAHGGGGHRRAAGCQILGEFEHAYASLMSAIRAVLDSGGADE